MAARKKGGRKYGKAAGKYVESALRRRKRGTLKGGRGGRVKSRKQAIAIGLAGGRRKGAKVPRKPRKGAAKKAGAKKGGRKKGGAKKAGAKKRAGRKGGGTKKGGRKKGALKKRSS